MSLCIRLCSHTYIHTYKPHAPDKHPLVAANEIQAAPPLQEAPRDHEELGDWMAKNGHVACLSDRAGCGGGTGKGGGIDRALPSPSYPRPPLPCPPPPPTNLTLAALTLENMRADDQASVEAESGQGGRCVRAVHYQGNTTSTMCGGHDKR